MKKILIFFLLLCTAHASLGLPAGAVNQEDLSAAMISYLNCFPLDLVELNGQEVSISNEELCLAAIYSSTGMKPLWVSENGPSENAAGILYFLEMAEREGLRPEDYNVAGIKKLWLSQEPDHLARLDTQLTLNLVKYAHDVSHGRVIPFETDPDLFAEAGDTHFNPIKIVEQTLTSPDLKSYLANLPPLHGQYRKLRQALQHYRDIVKAGGWAGVDGGKTLHPGDRDVRVVQVRQRLAKKEEVDVTSADLSLYDEQLVSVIQKFQERFGLEVDGIIGKKTLAALNKTPGEIVNSIIVNMARWRWQEHDLGRRHIMVNIANYDLKAVEDGREVLSMAVIVGQFQHQTPVFSHRVRYVDFNPFWNIPPSIARDEELPELRKDSAYLVQRKVRLFSSWQADAVELDSTAIDWQSVSRHDMNRYKLRQDPGPWNALGPVKLVFPNKYDVYIHGTPAQGLFEHNVRNFSHGCIRASQPLALVEFALSEEKETWRMEKIREIVEKGERKVVSLSKPLPVHITYQTVWVDNMGIIRFNTDSYARDSKLAEILFASEEISDNSSPSVSVREE